MKKSYINIVIIVLLILVPVIFQSCATILGGKKNSFIVKESCPENTKLYLDNTYIGKGPGKIVLEKGNIQHGSILELKADGYKSQKYLILRKINALYTIADIGTGGIWLGVDLATGSIYRPKPRVFSCDLNESIKQPVQ